MVKILIDSRASASIIRHSYVRKNKLATKNVTNQWTTMAGTFNTNQIVNINLKLPELNSMAGIKVECHVTKNESNYDIIIGRNVLRELGIILDFANNKTIWKETEIPMKPLDCRKKIEHFSIRDSVRMQNESKCLKKILDAKYSKANLNQLVCVLNYLNTIMQGKSLTFLRKYESLFDGTLGSYNGPDYKIELKEGIKPYHAKKSVIHR